MDRNTVNSYVILNDRMDKSSLKDPGSLEAQRDQKYQNSYREQKGGKLNRGRKEVLRTMAVCFMTTILTAAGILPSPGKDGALTAVTAQAASAPYMKIICIDLGNSLRVYGEAVLLESRGEYLLMDTGSRDSNNTVIRFLKSHGVRNLSLYISHFHEDHCDYAADILKDSYFRIKRVYLANPDPVRKYITPWFKSHKRKVYESCKEYLQRYNQISGAAYRKRIPVTALRKGKTFTVGDVRASVLWDHNTRGPEKFDPYDESGVGFQNNSSLVTRFRIGNKSFLTCGDIESSTERDLMASGVDLSADILKLSHHGMWTSSTDAFMRAVNPCYCFYSYKNLSDSEARRFASSAETASTLRRLAKRYNILGCRYNGHITYKVQYNTIRVYAQRHYKMKYIQVRNSVGGRIRTQRLVYNDAQPLFLDKRMLFAGTRIVSGTVQDRTPGYSGWHKDSAGWRYRTKNGKWLAGGWKRIGTSDYYFTARGYRYEGWLKLGGKTYFMSRLGVRQTGWQMIDGKFYYFSTKDAAMLRGRSWIGGAWWPLRSDGSLDISKKKAPNINITTSDHRHTTRK